MKTLVFFLLLHFDFHQKTLIIKNTHLELHLSEIEYEIIKIEEQGDNYPNLSMEERETLDNMMKDESALLSNQKIKEVVWLHGVRKIMRENY